MTIRDTTEAAPEPHRLNTKGESQYRRAVICAYVGAVLLLLLTSLFILVPQTIHALHPKMDPRSCDFQNSLYQKQTWILQWGLAFVVLLVGPAVVSRRTPKRRHGVAFVGLLLLSFFFAWFVFHFGNQQFGGWDFSILVDTGWRQILGQRPYTDFITPNPPGFNLGIYYAFLLFGVTWNAQIYAIILFCIGTFLWSYWLLRRIGAPPPAAFLLAFAVEDVTILTTCFWWYNNVTSLTAVVYFLSAVLCAKQSEGSAVAFRRDGAWLSYCISLALLGLMKPNTAGILIPLVTVLLLVVARERSRMLVYTAAGAALCLGILLCNHLSLRDMMASYQAAAIERGGFTHLGLSSYSRFAKLRLLTWTLLLAAPLFAVLPHLRRTCKRREWRKAAFLLLLWTALPVTMYGMLTNGEVKDSEAAILIVASGVIAFSLQFTRPALRIFVVAMVFSTLGASLYFGVERERLKGIGNGTYFEHIGADRPIRNNLFSSLTATPHLAEVEREVRRAGSTMPTPLFLGPRLEFNYADLRKIPPTAWPVYYQPGVSFARSREHELIEVWKTKRFATLIFLRGDRTFYPSELLDAIARDYKRVPGFQEVEVYSRADQ